MDDALRFRLLGGLSVQRLDAGAEAELDLGGPRPRRLLAALLLSLDQPLSPDRLIQLVWGDDAPASARGSLQAYISNLRRVLAPVRSSGPAPRIIVLRPGGYQLLVRRSQLDIGTFDAAVSRGATELDAGRPAAAADRLRGALDGWAPLLPEMEEVPFVRAEAAHLAARHATAFELLQTARMALGDHHDAIADLCRGVALDPRAERLWGLLALARYRSGHPADAIATLHAARTALGESGLSLGAELRRLETDLYAQTGALDHTAEGPALSIDPSATETLGRAHTRPNPHRCQRSTRARATLGTRHHRR